MNTKVSNNYKGVDIEVRPNSVIKLTRELEEVKPHVWDH
jgi:hypothetical protein